MSLPLVVAAAAEADINMALAWYETELPGLGNAFLECVEQALGRMCEQPAMYPLLVGNVRRALLHRFPYAVLYRLQPHAIEVIGVLPCRADPVCFVTRATTTGTVQ